MQILSRVLDTCLAFGEYIERFTAATQVSHIHLFFLDVLRETEMLRVVWAQRSSDEEANRALDAKLRGRSNPLARRYARVEVPTVTLCHFSPFEGLKRLHTSLFVFFLE